MTEYESGAPAPQERPNLWIGPLIFVAILVTLVLILIFSNTDSTKVDFAGFTVADNAPLWFILAITFVAGVIVTPIFGWAWRAFRKRRRRLKAEAGGQRYSTEADED